MVPRFALMGTQETTKKESTLALYEALAKAKPEKGSLDDWKRDTKALVEAAQGVVDGQENAAEQLKMALNCKACYEKFRPVYEADVGVTAERGLYAGSPPPEFALVANVSKVVTVMETAGRSAGAWPKNRVRNPCATSPILTPDCPSTSPNWNSYTVCEPLATFDGVSKYSTEEAREYSTSKLNARKAKTGGRGGRVGIIVQNRSDPLFP
jgi:hypothetical protein